MKGFIGVTMALSLVSAQATADMTKAAVKKIVLAEISRIAQGPQGPVGPAGPQGADGISDPGFLYVHVSADGNVDGTDVTAVQPTAGVFCFTDLDGFLGAQVTADHIPISPYLTGVFGHGRWVSTTTNLSCPANTSFFVILSAANGSRPGSFGLTLYY